MPELPEIETLCSQLRGRLKLSRIAQVRPRPERKLRMPAYAQLSALEGCKLLSVERRGKFVGFRLEQEQYLWFHLGMTGQIILSPVALPDEPHMHLRIRFDPAGEYLYFRDARRFGRILLMAQGDPEPGPLSLLGPDPFEMTTEVFRERLRGRSGRIKSLLLNQMILSGVGNIYADEILHRAGIDPRRRPARLTRSRIQGLFGALQAVLKEAIECGGSTIDDYRHVDGNQGNFQKYHRVYGRAGQKCFNCGIGIRCLKIAGRSSYFCPQCQK